MTDKNPNDYNIKQIKNSNGKIIKEVWVPKNKKPKPYTMTDVSGYILNPDDYIITKEYNENRTITETWILKDGKLRPYSNRDTVSMRGDGLKKPFIINGKYQDGKVTFTYSILPAKPATGMPAHKRLVNKEPTDNKFNETDIDKLEDESNLIFGDSYEIISVKDTTPDPIDLKKYLINHRLSKEEVKAVSKWTRFLLLAKKSSNWLRSRIWKKKK